MSATAGRGRGRALADAVQAETAKLVSLPASWLVLGGTLALTVVLSAAFGSGGSVGPDARERALDLAVTALTWTQCGFVLLGVVTATSEYVGGQVRTTLVAVPDRVAWRLAATVALASVAFVAGIVVAVASVAGFLGAAGLPGSGIDLGQAARVVLSAAGYLSLMSVLASALGIIVRRAIPAAAGLLLYLLVVSPLLQDFRLYALPDVASYILWFTGVPDSAPPAPVAWLVIVAWTLAFLVPSIVLARRRDA